MEDPVEQAERALTDVPLCDRCLGRLFAMLGRGLSNDERGKALKLAVVLRLHSRIREGDREALDKFREIAPNVGPLASRLYEELFGSKLEPRSCVICGGSLDSFVDEAAARAYESLAAYNVRSFLIGVRVPQEYVAREEELKSRHSLKYSESLKSELKRQIGKLVQARYGLRPDFTRPDAIATVEFPTGRVEVSVRRLGIAVSYFRFNRWLPIRPYKLHPLVKAIIDRVGGASVAVHGLVRDELGVRVLGAGLPLVIEVSRPRSRDVLRPGDTIEVEGAAFKVKAIDAKPPSQDELARRVRTYRCVITSEASISTATLSLASSSIIGKQVRQRVGSHEAVGQVRGISCVPITDRAAECLVSVDEKIYIRELITGEGTTPSLSEALATKLECLSADLVGVS
ncbi:MAG: tRNA pseudouridine(55) synthase [Acidilobus sp.]